MARALEADPDVDLRAFLQAHHARERAVFVYLPDGRALSPRDLALSDGLRDIAAATLAGSVPTSEAARRMRGIAVLAPVRVRNATRALVVMPPFGPGGPSWLPPPFLSLPALFTIALATVLAAVLVFRPARRRLAALEDAARRIGKGDWAVRAPETGDDEIAAVARAFNHMGVELSARDQALSESNRLRRQMLADVSHELKTPLTAMLGFVETLQDDRVALGAARRTRYLATIARETRRLERLVHDLLDLTRHENAAARFETRVFSVARLFAHVVARHETSAQARGIVLRTEVDDVADQMQGDPDRLEQAIDNLVSNAMHHVPDAAQVTLRAVVEGPHVALTVTDTGPGIAQEHLPHVFDRFYKADAARTTGAAGSGLGLSIVRAIVERHGGTIDVESAPGQTVFTMRLPHQPAEST